jgi:hypothetical protein
MNRRTIVFRPPGLADPVVKIPACFGIFASTFWQREPSSVNDNAVASGGGRDKNHQSR